jgi:hypothetical protein
METTLSDDVFEQSLESLGDATLPCTGIVSELGGCPLGILHQVLLMTSLYDRYCWGASNSRMCNAVVSMDIGIPVTSKVIEDDPELLLTPVFKEGISLLLQFHLPAACSHARIFFHIDSNGISFLCQHCGGSIKFKLAAIEALSQLAYCSGFSNKSALRLRCLKLINEMEKPIVVGMKSRFDAKQGHTCEVILKEERRVQSTAPPHPVPGDEGAASKVGSKCTCTTSPDPSGDENELRGSARLGRRKGRRRGVKSSRMMRYFDDSCPRCCNATCS